MPAKRALVVAINDYGGDGRNNLPSCINDAEVFRTILQQKYSYSEIHALFDAEATEAKVEAELDWLVKDAKPDDRLVFYFSGHGYSKLTNGVQEEFLVLRNGGGPLLYIDNKFAAKLRNLPPGVFTAVMDCCFSAGTYKDFVFDDSGGVPKVEEFLNKRLPFPPDEEVKALTKSFNLPAIGPGGTAPAAGTGAPGTAAAGTATAGTVAARTGAAAAAQPAAGPAPSIIRSYRRFGCVPTSSPSVLTRVYRREPGGSAAYLGKALSDPTEQPQPEVSGIMYAACQEFETAAASTSQTQGLSAFTYALRHSLDRIGYTKAGVEVFAATASRLQELSFKQTPVLLERAAPGDLKHKTFITSLSPKSAEVVAAEKAFGAAAVDEKLFGAIIGRLAEVIPQVAPIVFDAVVGRRKGMAGYVPVASEPVPDEKFIGAILGTLAQVIPQVAPILIDAVTTQRKQASVGMFGEAEAAPEAEEKFIPLLIGALASTIPHVAPMIVNAVRGRRKELEGVSILGGGAQSEADDKFFGAILGAVASVIPQVAPIIIDAVRGRRKELEGVGPATTSTQVDEKFIGAILGTLAQVIPHVAPVIIDAVAGRRKAIGGLGAPGGAFEPDEKFLSDILRTCARTIPYLVPRIVDAVAGRRKELVGISAAGGAVEADEKFLGAVLGTLAQVIPHVAPVIINAVSGRRKEIAGATGITTMGSLAVPEPDEKFLGAIVGAVAQMIPHVAPIIIDAIAGRRKELEGMALTGSATGIQADEKWLGGLINRCLTTLPPLLPPILAPTRAAMGVGTKAFDVGLEPAASGGEVDEKFLGAVLGAAVSLAPTIIQALTARRKEFGGELGGPAQPEVDEKFLGAVLRTAVALAPTLIQTLTARQKDVSLGELGAAQPPQADEKFLGAVLSAAVSLAPSIIQALGARRKEFGGVELAGTAQPAVDEKFLGSVLRAAVALAPTLMQALGGRQKELGLIEPSGGAQPQVDEKFLGAVLSAAVSLAPSIIEALSGRQKSFSAEPTMGASQVDEKFLGAVLRTAVALAPTLLQTLTRQKELGGGIQQQTSLSSFAM